MEFQHRNRRLHSSRGRRRDAKDEKLFLFYSPTEQSIKDIDTISLKPLHEERPLQVPIQRNRNDTKAFINRLATPKKIPARDDDKDTTVDRAHSSRQLSAHAQRAVDRLSAPKRYSLDDTIPQKKKTMTAEEQMKMCERLASLRKRREPPTLDRGRPHTSEQIEKIVDRLSSVKKHKEPVINRRVAIEKRDMTKSQQEKLVARLSDPNYARKRTPDTRRLIDKRYTPLNTYAWQGMHPQGVLSGEIVLF